MSNSVVEGDPLEWETLMIEGTGKTLWSYAFLQQEVS